MGDSTHTKANAPAATAQQPSSHLQSRPFFETDTQAKVSANPQFRFGNIAVQPPLPPIQPKLTIGQPGDPYEQEADRVAAQVVEHINIPQPQAQPLQRQMPEEEELQMKSSSGAIQRQVPEEEEELQMKASAETLQRQIPEEEEALQMKSSNESVHSTVSLQMNRDVEKPSTGDIVQRAQQGITGSGSEIPQRATMEKAFGVSFENVTAHLDSNASEACTAIGANAYATGTHVAFKTPNPDTELIAHELTHVVQQSGLMKPSAPVGQVGDVYEQEADAVARRVTRGESVSDVVQAHAHSATAADAQAIQKQDEEQETETPLGPQETGNRQSDPDVEQQQNAPLEATETEEDVIQADRDTAWAGNYVEVSSPPRSLIGNVSPESGSYSLGYSYSVRLLYVGDTRGGIDGPDGETLVTKGHRISHHGGLVFGPNLPSTSPGQYKVWLDNPGGAFSKSMHAEENFSVVDPIRINTETRRTQRLYDFQNPIPLQMTGDSKLEFQLTANHVHNRRVAVNASGSRGSSVSEKLSFGVQVGLDNDEGSSGSGAWGFSSATQGSYQRQWNSESYHQAETSTGTWRKYTFNPTQEEAGRSKMLIPMYEWVEWDAEVYPHDPNTLLTTGDQQTVVIGMLRPTGEVQEMRSTDEGIQSNSAPTEDAQTDINPNDPTASEQYDQQLSTSPGWRVLPGARVATDDSPNTLQYIKGPISMQPAGRDYGQQNGAPIHPGNSSETVEFGNSYSVNLQDGLTASQSAEQSGVTTYNESKSLEANPGIKGLGSIGDSLSFENESALSSSTGTGLSQSEGWGRTVTTTVTHTVTKNDKNQFIIFTPLVNHKVFEVGYGCRLGRDADRLAIPGQDFDTFFIHTYQHSPVPHVTVLNDVGRNPDHDALLGGEGSVESRTEV